MQNNTAPKGVSRLNYFILGISALLFTASVIILIFATQRNKQLNPEYNDIRIVVDGERIIPRDDNGNALEPFVIDGTVYLPASSICEAVGYNVEWDRNTSTVYVYLLSDFNPGIQSTEK